MTSRRIQTQRNANYLKTFGETVSSKARVNTASGWGKLKNKASKAIMRKPSIFKSQEQGQVSDLMIAWTEKGEEAGRQGRNLASALTRSPSDLDKPRRFSVLKNKYE
tara:strand:- start:139 stop:459 length:321 start_codon:yes stop_codon:yes gene_type:complete